MVMTKRLTTRTQSRSTMIVLIQYTLFAAVATVGNLISQDICVRLSPSDDALLGPLLVGTAIGLAIKYTLDRRYIFQARRLPAMGEVTSFAYYALTGVLTTAVFWTFEWSFDYYFQTRTYRYLGAVIGLAIGYWMKYHLDKRFVFVEVDHQ